MMSQSTSHLMYMSFIVVGLLLIVLLLFRLLSVQRKRKEEKPIATVEHMGCSVHSAGSCGAIDPVSDPAYNMKEVIKVSLLLEDHLTQKNKRCKDCILKHLLQLAAYTEEALALAGDNADNYPYLIESDTHYAQLLNVWLEDTANEDAMLSIASRLREWRKKLMAAYYPIGNGVDVV